MDRSLAFDWSAAASVTGVIDTPTSGKRGPFAQPATNLHLHASRRHRRLKARTHFAPGMELDRHTLPRSGPSTAIGTGESNTPRLPPGNIRLAAKSEGSDATETLAGNAGKPPPDDQPLPGTLPHRSWPPVAIKPLVHRLRFHAHHRLRTLTQHFFLRDHLFSTNQRLHRTETNGPRTAARLTRRTRSRRPPPIAPRWTWLGRA